MEERRMTIGEIRRIAQDVFEGCGATVVDVKKCPDDETYIVVLKGPVYLNALNLFAERVGDGDFLVGTTGVYDESRLFFNPG